MNRQNAVNHLIIKITCQMRIDLQITDSLIKVLQLLTNVPLPKSHYASKNALIYQSIIVVIVSKGSLLIKMIKNHAMTSMNVKVNIYYFVIFPRFNYYLTIIGRF